MIEDLVPVAFGEPHVSPLRVGDLAFEVPIVPAGAPVAEVDRLFRRDRQLRAVIVKSAAASVLLTREHLEFELSGPFGYGRCLHARSPVSAVASDEHVTLPAATSLAEAAQAILSRHVEYRYHDVLVDDAGDPKVLTVSAVFTELSRVFRAGDDVLVAFAERLRCCVRPSDVLARLGGDEFAVLLSNVSEADARAIADRIVLSAAVPFIIDDQPVYLSASVGFAMATDIVGEFGHSALDVLLRHADGEMLQAKRSGKPRATRLQQAVPALSISRPSQLRRRLAQSLQDGAGLALHYQPKVDLATGATSSVEALLRWRDAELGDVEPAEFVPIAEQSDQIHQLGYWVLEEAFAQARRWLDSGAPRWLSINVSAVQLASDTFADELFASMNAYGLATSLVRIEVTARSPLSELARITATLRTISTAGIDIELDDFGTSHSSLDLLRELPLTTVEISGSLIAKLGNDVADTVVVAGIIDLAHALGLGVSATGVETAAQLRILREIGCDSAQGFLIARPSPAAALATAVSF